MLDPGSADHGRAVCGLRGCLSRPGIADPWVAAVIASLLTTWVTFVPCFLFVLLGAPYVERLRHNHALTAALTGITAAVVGVIASLAAYFALHTLFDATELIDSGPLHFEVPVPGSLDLAALGVLAVACWLIFARRLGGSDVRSVSAPSSASCCQYT